MKKINILIFLLISPFAIMASGGKTFPNDNYGANASNAESVQRGAKYYVNYCLGCHELKYQRYNRLGKDTGLSEEIIKKNLMFSGSNVAATMTNSLPKDKAANWFGKVPPDLSLISRSKNKNYVYNYLRGFYLDSSKPTGSNNSVFPDVGMPNVLSSLEGIKKPVKNEHHEVIGFESVSKGSVTTDEFDSIVTDLSNFLYYVSDPSQLKRQSLGWKVILFLVLMTGIFYLLKKEFWKDVH